MQATVSEYRSDVAVLHLHGELDAASASDLQFALDGLLEREVPRVVVDLAGLRFCDSIGLSAFITTYTAVTRRGGWLRFVRPSPFLRRLIETVGLTRYIGVYSDVEEAARARG